MAKLLRANTRMAIKFPSKEFTEAIQWYHSSERKHIRECAKKDGIYIKSSGRFYSYNKGYSGYLAIPTVRIASWFGVSTGITLDVRNLHMEFWNKKKKRSK